MNISKIFKSCMICCAVSLSIGNNVCNAVEIDLNYLEEFDANYVNNMRHLLPGHGNFEEILKNVKNHYILLSNINDARKTQTILRGFTRPVCSTINWNQKSFRGAVLYLDNHTRLCVDQDGYFINIFQENNLYNSIKNRFAIDGKNIFEECNKWYEDHYKGYFDKLNQIVKGKDFITYLREDARAIFGNDYKVYFNYRKIDYKDQKTKKDDQGYTYKQMFKGTFDELLKANENDELVMTIKKDLQFMKKMWINNLNGFSFDTGRANNDFYCNDQFLVITNNSITYYFDIENNLIKIYSNRHSGFSANKACNIMTYKFLETIKKRWETEQTEVRKLLDTVKQTGGIYYIPEDEHDKTICYVEKLPK